MGFSGDPESSPSILLFLILSTSTGNREKNTIHHIITKITTDPVILNLNPYQLDTCNGFFASYLLSDFSTGDFNSIDNIILLILIV